MYNRAYPQSRLRIYFLLCVFIALCVLIGSFLYVKNYEMEMAMDAGVPAVDPFPLGVYPSTKTIAEVSGIEDYRAQTRNHAMAPKQNFSDAMSAMLYKFSWYQQMASPVTRILVIWPGERKEEITKNFSDILGWNQSEREVFMTKSEAILPTLTEGMYTPGRYVVPYDASPEAVASLLIDRLESELLVRYPNSIRTEVPIEDALIIASLIEREAYDFTDMRYISGVIWNRLFIDMRLQLDATLQYAKGSDPYEPAWWPQVKPEDKFIDSAFNTYQNKGLPPAPIANPSLSSVIAALNPRSTDCLFYFHEDNGTFHCSEDYEGHVAKLKELYGRGK